MVIIDFYCFCRQLDFVEMYLINKEVKILGIDPGLRVTGYGVIFQKNQRQHMTLL